MPEVVSAADQVLNAIGPALVSGPWRASSALPEFKYRIVWDNDGAVPIWGSYLQEHVYLGNWHPVYIQHSPAIFQQLVTDGWLQYGAYLEFGGRHFNCDMSCEFIDFSSYNTNSKITDGVKPYSGPEHCIEYRPGPEVLKLGSFEKVRR